jgi:hypothetical protein
MMNSRRLSRVAALAALGGMLFLQAALAFAACQLPERSAAKALSAHAAMPDCHEAQQDANLCLAHCQSEDQTFGKAQLQVPEISAPVLVSLPQALPLERPFLGVAHTAAGPPPRILFRSFRL